MKNKLYTVLVFTRLNTRRFFRDRLAIFFGILFPVIFLVIFGGIFGKSSGSVSFHVAVLNQSHSQFSTQFVSQLKKDKAYKVDETVTTLGDAKQKMSRSQLDATIVLPPSFGAIQGDHPTGNAEVYYTQNNSEAGQTLVSVLQGTFKGVNSKLVKVNTPFTAVGKEVKEKSLTQFDYTFSGLLGFSIIGLGIFGPVNVFPELKKQGILRRLHTTPLRVWQYFLSTMLSQAAVGLVSLAVMFAVAIGVFHLHVVGNYLEVALFLVFGIFVILGIGLAIGGWARNERQAAPLANLVVFPLMFLTGVFFPRFLMPEWLQSITNYLPLTPIIDGIRLMVTEGQHLVSLGSQLGIMAIWMVVIYALAFRVFRWE